MFLMRAIPVVLWLSIAITSIGCGGALSQLDLGALLTRGRDGWQHPERVIASLDLERGDRVAEIGAGEGYWLPWLSAAVGPEGRVHAVEVTPALVARLESRVAAQSLANVDVILGGYDDPNLPEGGVDLALTCLTYHHIEDRVAYFRRLREDLDVGARVVHLDDRPDVAGPVGWFVSADHASDPEEVVREMRAAGYRRIDAHAFLPTQSFQVFAPDVGTARPDDRIATPDARGVR